MRKGYAKWIAVLALAAGAAKAEAPPPAAPATESAAQEPAIGEVTRQWLESQRRGRQASAKPQPLSGPVQEQVYERYRKSFARPIPERFESERPGDAGR